MKAHCLLVLIAIQLSETADCCSSDINKAVDYAFVSCPTNVSCVAKCYRGYKFPSGSTNESYSCQNGEWAPILSSCKRIPLVSVTYVAIWGFTEFIPSKCTNISSRLDNVEVKLEMMLTTNCHQLNTNATVQFTYSFLSFQVHTNFTAEYHNFSDWETLNVCINYNMHSFPKLLTEANIFDGVTCQNKNTSYTINKTMSVQETHYICPSDMELHNVMTPVDGMYKPYCDSTVTTTKMTTETTVTQINMRTPGSQSLTTEVSLTYENSNISQSTTISEFFGEKDHEAKSFIYIAAPAGGVFLISVIIIILKCLRIREKNPENLKDDKNITRETKHRKEETSFNGELIENELYKSADDVVSCKSNEDFTNAATGDFSAAPYSKEKNDPNLKVDQDQYSYPCKISNARHNVSFVDDTDCDLDGKGMNIIQTPIHDSENSCQYAVVNKSRKL